LTEVLNNEKRIEQSITTKYTKQQHIKIKEK